MNKPDLLKPEDVITATEQYIDAIKKGEIDFPSVNTFLEELEYSARLGRIALEQKVRDFNRTADLRRRRIA